MKHIVLHCMLLGVNPWNRIHVQHIKIIIILKQSLVCSNKGKIGALSILDTQVLGQSV